MINSRMMERWELPMARWFSTVKSFTIDGRRFLVGSSGPDGDKILHKMGAALSHLNEVHPDYVSDPTFILVSKTWQAHKINGEPDARAGIYILDTARDGRIGYGYPLFTIQDLSEGGMPRCGICRSHLRFGSDDPSSWQI